MSPSRPFAAPRWIAAFALALGTVLAAPAEAHKSSDAYLTLDVHGERVDERLDIALRDLERELALDANQDGQLSWGEVRARWGALQSLAAQGVMLSADGRACRVDDAASRGTPPQLDEHSDGRYAVLRRQWRCDAPVRQLEVDYRLFATSDPQHRGIVRLMDQGRTQSAVLGPESPRHGFDLGTPAGAPTTLAGFVGEGVHHILIGTDHILFLLALLLPAVLTRTGVPRAGGGEGAPRGGAGGSTPRWLRLGLLRVHGQGELALGLAPPQAAAQADTAAPEWRAAPALKPALLDVLKVVTAFTVAHSITLALAVLDLVDPPSRWVESIIAASVALAALNNLRPVVREGRWTITFAFGLVHGFGFAGALKDLGLGGASLAAPLVGFNLGVELGQLAIVALFVPIAWALRGTRFYRRGVLGLGSLTIAAIAFVWLLERAFDWQLFRVG